MRIQSRNDDGFTMIELIMVLFIIGLLVVISLVSFVGFSERAESVGTDVETRSAILENAQADGTLTSLEQVVVDSIALEPADRPVVMLSTDGEICVWGDNGDGTWTGLWESTPNGGATLLTASFTTLPSACPTSSDLASDSWGS
ncbi:MAG: prepilin-type N-terminal cleavage/methylation domain-containing protein [Acidimicrobiia bacterium]|nr:prepilin-type N-terminal cleavage/methylation domain-containing protein [Acidimicrobiia bacterium]NNC75557.1 prepilin-type N-terminal cleavage/methylation domain-containing protein [Acidimicrobiia bacterium]